MNAYVVDASVAIQMFLGEEHADAVADLFASEATLRVTDLFHIECTNILWKRVTRGLYPALSARENLADLAAMRLPTTPTAEFMPRAFELGCAHRVTAYDACYLALAERYACPLITADMPLHAALAGSHITVLTIEEYLALVV